MYKLLNRGEKWHWGLELQKSVSLKCWMLSRWILFNRDMEKNSLEKALFMAFLNNDSKTAKVISWGIVRRFYTDYKYVLTSALDIYPGTKCKCLHADFNYHGFCSHEKIITVTSESNISGLPKVYLGFKIEVYNLTDLLITTLIKREIENFMGTNFKKSFRLKIDVPATTAEDLFTKHSNLTLVCPSVVKWHVFRDFCRSERKICIQLHCIRKSIIPIDEQHFPGMLHGIPTNVIEGHTELMTNLHVGDKIGTRACTGTLAGFVRHMKVFDCFLTCAHVMIDLKTLLSNDYRGEEGGEAFVSTPTGQFQCGNLIWRAFDHDDPHKTSVDAALVLMQNYATIGGIPSPLQSLYLNSPYLNLNSNCVDHEELCCLNKTEKVYCYGAETGHDICGDVKFPKQSEIDIHFSNTGINGASVNGQVFQPLWLYQPVHVQLASGCVGDRRVFRMYNQIGLNLPLRKGDSGTGVYIVNNPIGKNGCVGMAIAFCPTTGISIVTPLKDILKRIYS